MKRAYSVLTLRSIDEGKREFEGIATTPTPDRYGDIVESKGAEFQLPIPLLLHHDVKQPIGEVYYAKVTADGILVRGRVFDIDEAGSLQDRLKEAWQSIKIKLIRGLSIGFKPLEYSFLDDGEGIRFLKWLWLELSAVVIPANVEATIVSVKSYDSQSQAALGHKAKAVAEASLITPGATGSTATTRSNAVKKTIAEQINDFSARRAAIVARQQEIMNKASAEEGRTLDETESQEYDGLISEQKQVDDHLVRLRALEQSAVERAPRIEVQTPADASNLRAGLAPVELKRKLAPGIEFARYAMCLGAAKGDLMLAQAIAKKRFANDGPNMHAVLKAAVEAGSTSDANWAGNLVEYTVMSNEFIDYLRPLTIIGRIPGLRRVPFNIKVKRQTAKGSASWVGEGKPKPITKAAFDNVTLRWTKIAAISVLTEELVRFSNPSAETLVRDELAASVIERSDIDFIDPAKAEVADVSPASITNGANEEVSTGNDAAAIADDVKALFAGFIAANLSPTTAVWLMSSSTALSLSLMRNALGQKEFPDVNLNGGNFEGLPVITSEYVVGDSTGGLVVLAAANEIYLADDGQVQLDASREASLEMADDPTNDSVTPTETSLVSMWQTNSVALRAERYINWKRRRDAAVQVLTGVNWGASGS